MFLNMKAVTFIYSSTAKASEKYIMLSVQMNPLSGEVMYNRQKAKSNGIKTQTHTFPL